jgi:superfamily II DNA or RNA helicase
MKKCKIVVKDEVNCSITNLDLPVRKQLSKKFKIEIPGAKYNPKVKLGRWDGCVNFFTIGGSTYINLLPDIIPIIQSHGYEIELEDLRNYGNSYDFETIKNDFWGEKCWPTGHRLENQPIRLNDHQVEIVNAALQNTQSISLAATGSGKTIVTATLSKIIEPYGKSIVIVPTKTLVSQTESDYANVGLDVGVYYGDRKDLSRAHTICTWQSLDRLLKRGEEALDEVEQLMSGLVCVICDEAHGAKAAQLREMLSGIFSHIPIRWGLTGTIPKDEYAAISLKVCLGEVVSEVNASDLQELGHLSRCHINVIQLLDYGQFRNYQQELSYLVTNEKRIIEIANIIAEIKQGGNTLVLVDRIATGKLLLSYLGEEKAVFVSGATKDSSRKEEYKNISCNDDTILIATYGVAAVGISIDRIFNLVMIEPGKSFVRVIQSIGRGLRRAVDKDFVNIWDITSSCKYSKKHLTERKKFYREAKYSFDVQKRNWLE